MKVAEKCSDSFVYASPDYEEVIFSPAIQSETSLWASGTLFLEMERPFSTTAASGCSLLYCLDGPGKAGFRHGS